VEFSHAGRALSIGFSPAARLPWVCLITLTGLFVRNPATPLRVWSVSLDHPRFDRCRSMRERDEQQAAPAPSSGKTACEQITRLLMAILIIAIFALAIALEATGHVIFRGRLIFKIAGSHDRNSHDILMSRPLPLATIVRVGQPGQA
jgi:hypothetical protein